MKQKKKYKKTLTSPKSQGSFNIPLSLNNQADRNNNMENLNNKINRIDLSRIARLSKRRKKQIKRLLKSEFR